MQKLKEDPVNCAIPEDPQDIRNHFANLRQYIDAKSQDASDQLDSCNSHTNSTEMKLEECGKDQLELERAVCSYRLQVHTTCAEQAKCYAVALEGYNSKKGSADVSKAAIEFEYS